MEGDNEIKVPGYWLFTAVEWVIIRLDIIIEPQQSPTIHWLSAKHKGLDP